MQCPLVLLVKIMHMIGINFYMTLKGLHYSKIWSNIGRATLRRNFEITIGRAACEACSAMRNLGTKSSFALGRRKPTENLDRVSRSQTLLDANWLLASSSALNTRTLLVPIWLLLYLNKVNIFVFVHVSFYMHTLDEHQTLAHNWLILWMTIASPKSILILWVNWSFSRP
jgi:hypothetical protein